jgi:hypothetical protein
LSKGRLLICSTPIPDDWKPLARFDQVGADQQTGDEAVELFEQHRFLAKGEQFLVKLLEAARQTGHRCSNSMAAIREAAPREGGDAGEHIGRRTFTHYSGVPWGREKSSGKHASSLSQQSEFGLRLCQAARTRKLRL